MDIIKPKKLHYGDTIGLVAPCIALNQEHAQNSINALKTMGFKIKEAKYLYSNSIGFSGSIEERAYDFNSMIADDEVKMLLFGGGEVCNELLPYIDYDSIRRHPKIICSYSDSTTLLNAINYMCGLVTFYGASIGTFGNLSEYNRQSFESRLMGCGTSYVKASPWKTICPGKCEGVLAGGYLVNYAVMYGLEQYPEIPYDDCILFIEDHEMFSPPAMVSKWFANLEHRGAFKKARGLIFGHYSNKEYTIIDDILRRVGEKYHIPVVRSEDFGHGANNAILPIGTHAMLDTGADSFELLDCGVC
ncbi:MAG: LD-carboxypeptidase [Clostridiales bacterium]|nr:LD-carboxypeptidase [Clostridiales bacterium]